MKEIQASHSNPMRQQAGRWGEIAFELQALDGMKKAKTKPQDLATLRKLKGISLMEIADVTKIGVRYLEAIERGEFARLPGGIYGISYIRQYARMVAVPEADLLDRYLRLSR